ncbi:hypothetical protein GSU68_13800 [Rathayibacter sp. VKM Ac-2759]|uniref:hypothetical protein n=1 Tax=Rathayibacter sp. VKM Ac-2759 TaxID=2609252 RepID=UPI0013195256|nr:hypothetical protein [Rathayibacter sp. VKM Ac-2759]QHC67538.1 hypothetical protein GSU68_13800 [Rathayibacter sp. VKM Ac-2759]
MTWNSEAETARMPASETTGATGPQPTREYVWPEPQPGGTPPTAETPVAPNASPAPLGSVEPDPAPVRRKGNRLAGLAIALLATAVFAALLLVALTAIRILLDQVAGDPLTIALDQGPTAVFLAPVAAFFLGLALIVLAVNRAGWWAYVLGGFFVAVLAGAAALVGAWLPVGGAAVPSDRTLLVEFLRDPAVLASVLSAAVLAREVSVWGGALIAGRARGVKRRNAEREAAAQS